ncbi:MAG: 4-alpha-glucanotransferase [Bacteroidetes bacterium]|nr:MAG: 4-alpha-glucanotransferase [Bacteroidota bacterium]
MNTERSSGILLHPTSLPGKYGIGTLGKESFHFIDFLAKSKQKLWQILPLGPTGFADSPYQCFSSAAGNPLLIDLDILVKEGLLDKKDLAGLDTFDDGPVDYGRVIQTKYPLLRKAMQAFREHAGKEHKKDFYEFTVNNKKWLEDYTLFMSLKEHFNQKPWYQWAKPLKMRKKTALKPFHSLLSDHIEFHKFIQYLFFRQWLAIKDYAHQKNIRIIGDIPLYVALDSVDAWVNTDLFQFDADKNPIVVGGVPPDYFSSTGQLWGNPLYRWDVLHKDHYRWWIERIKSNLVLYDIIRIDHFRGFAAYWAVPYGEKTAVNGKWIPCPGKELFEQIRKELGEIPIIAEDLGVITQDVEDLRDSFGLPGMKILQFAFDSSEANDYLPHNFIKNCIVYTGTHDNDTIKGWFGRAKQEDRKYVLDYLDSTENEICTDFLRLAWASVAHTAIVPMQDLLELGNEARMNLPGTTINNWMWRAKSRDFSNKLAQKLAHLTVLYGRTHKGK